MAQRRYTARARTIDIRYFRRFRVQNGHAVALRNLSLMTQADIEGTCEGGYRLRVTSAADLHLAVRGRASACPPADHRVVARQDLCKAAD